LDIEFYKSINDDVKEALLGPAIDIQLVSLAVN